MKTKSNTKAGALTLNHNEKIARADNEKHNAERNDRRQSRRNEEFGIKVMSIRTGIKAGWISRNYK